MAKTLQPWLHESLIRSELSRELLGVLTDHPPENGATYMGMYEQKIINLISKDRDPEKTVNNHLDWNWSPGYKEMTRRPDPEKFYQEMANSDLLEQFDRDARTLAEFLDKKTSLAEMLDKIHPVLVPDPGAEKVSPEMFRQEIEAEDLDSFLDLILVEVSY